VLSSKQPRKVTFVRPSGDAFRTKRRSNHESCIHPFPFLLHTPAARCVNGEVQLFAYLHVAILHVRAYLVSLDRPAISACYEQKLLRSQLQSHDCTWHTLSRLTDFHSARLTCVTLPDLESKAFQAGLLSQR
jgi:hypothetical protein